MLKLAGLSAVSGLGLATVAQEKSRAEPTVTGFTYDGTPLVAVESAQAPTAIREVEPNDSRDEAMLIGLNVPVTGTLAYKEVDWYAVEVSSGDAFVVEFERAEASGITAVVLYGPGGQFLDQRYVGHNEPVSVTETASTDGVHYVQVVDIADGIDEYSIAVRDGTTSPTPTTATATESDTPSSTPTETETSSPTETETPSPTETETPSPTPTEAASPAPTETPSSTPTATSTPTPSPTDSPTPSPTPISAEYGQVGYGEYGYGGVVS
ncbi:alpha beta-propellor repeat-containing integrin [Halosimplex carlsbadense 2-9-1]|uniref:Alpha beta-propellor repeat-containing integrin n=1 Tax=Halosimplex carlsbadense 2-9-1 TaxID=797114 RepID=M0C9Q8_9EURY|nr:alpha beta-propellor repeat-containing integrin [Halosimplex carlsbadense 2-9-1]